MSTLHEMAAEARFMETKSPTPAEYHGDPDVDLQMVKAHEVLCDELRRSDIRISAVLSLACISGSVLAVLGYLVWGAP